MPPRQPINTGAVRKLVGEARAHRIVEALEKDEQIFHAAFQTMVSIRFDITNFSQLLLDDKTEALSALRRFTSLIHKHVTQAGGFFERTYGDWCSATFVDGNAIPGDEPPSTPAWERSISAIRAVIKEYHDCFKNKDTSLAHAIRVGVAGATSNPPHEAFATISSAAGGGVPLGFFSSATIAQGKDNKPYSPHSQAEQMCAMASHDRLFDLSKILADQAEKKGNSKIFSQYEALSTFLMNWGSMVLLSVTDEQAEIVESTLAKGWQKIRLAWIPGEFQFLSRLDPLHFDGGRRIILARPTN